MKDEIVKFITAQLARDKGFNIPVINYYTRISKYIWKNYVTQSEGYQTERLVKSNWNNGEVG